MKHIMLAALAFTLAGCASTVTDLRQTKPVMDGYSAKPVSVYSECLLNKWSEHSYLQPVIAKSSSDGDTLQFKDFWDGTVFLVDVKKAGGGSHFTLYRSRAISFYEEALLSCK
ncbi:hypothetical protein [Martelella alba]|uniref:Lipoprotein n=1 Tax=Martelella alba TaxID=2590451 RepID=A0ABY2SJM9_9HYPH|nr:hypothetical protein [Martelella alba]TKI05521.1 hypothetical protein FCN80_14205 [Martelella alba]